MNELVVRNKGNRVAPAATSVKSVGSPDYFQDTDCSGAGWVGEAVRELIEVARIL